VQHAVPWDLDKDVSIFNPPPAVRPGEISGSRGGALGSGSLPEHPMAEDQPATSRSGTPAGLFHCHWERGWGNGNHIPHVRHARVIGDIITVVKARFPFREAARRCQVPFQEWTPI